MDFLFLNILGLGDDMELLNDHVSKQASRNHAGICSKNNELMCPRTGMCSLLLFQQTAGCFCLFLTREGC